MDRSRVDVIAVNDVVVFDPKGIKACCAECSNERTLGGSKTRTSERPQKYQFILFIQGNGIGPIVNAVCCSGVSDGKFAAGCSVESDLVQQGGMDDKVIQHLRFRIY